MKVSVPAHRYKANTEIPVVVLHVSRIRVSSHWAKANAKAKFFLDVWIFSLISSHCSLMFFTFVFAFARCKWALTINISNLISLLLQIFLLKIPNNEQLTMRCNFDIFLHDVQYHRRCLTAWDFCNFILEIMQFYCITTIVFL